MLFLRRAAAAFVEGLHPEGFGGVSYGFGESMQGGGTCVQSGRESLSPSIQERVDGVGRAGAEFPADFFDGGAFAGTRQGVGGAFDVTGRDAAARRSEPVGSLGAYR
jgi:hypothetical protein